MGEPGACSPSVFSGSVPNACVGQICIINGLKGFSTILAGGDPLEYSALLLETNRADYILAGSVEEYFPPLYEAFQTLKASEGCDLSEGAAMTVLSREKTENSYCRMICFAGINLGKCPYIHYSSDLMETKKEVMDVLRQFPKPDLFFSSANGTWFDTVEKNAFQEIFPDVPMEHPKSFFGETLGCGYMMNTLYGAGAMTKKTARRILISGLDMIGNYCCVMLEKC